MIVAVGIIETVYHRSRKLLTPHGEVVAYAGPGLADQHADTITGGKGTLQAV